MEFTRISEELASADDVTAQVPWRATRGKVLARRGALAEGEQLIREAVAIAEKTDWLWLLADALMDRAEVNLAAGEPRQAVNAVERALELYERKGIVPSAARASALLETLTTKADP